MQRAQKRGTGSLPVDPHQQYDYSERKQTVAPVTSKKRKRPGADVDFTRPSGRIKVEPVPERPDPLVEGINRKLEVPLPRLHFILQFIAPRGSGKTTLLINFLTRWYKQLFHAVYVVSPTMKNDSKWDEVKLNPERVYHNPKPENINKVLAEIRGLPKSQVKLVVFDDCIGKGMKKLDEFFEFIFQHRHWKTSIISCVQGFKMVDKMIRTNTTHYVLYPIWNEAEVKDIAEELGMDWRYLSAIMPTEKYAFLFIDRQNNAIYQNFDLYLGPLRAPPSELPAGGADSEDEESSMSSEDEKDYIRRKRSRK